MDMNNKTEADIVIDNFEKQLEKIPFKLVHNICKALGVLFLLGITLFICNFGNSMTLPQLLILLNIFLFCFLFVIINYLISIAHYICYKNKQIEYEINKYRALLLKKNSAND